MNPEKKRKTRSIRTEIILIFTAVTSLMIAVLVVLNLILLPKYYVRNKEQVLKNAYNSLNYAVGDGSVRSHSFKNKLIQLCSIYNISVIVIDSNSDTVEAAGANTEALTNILLDRVLNKDNSNYKIIEKTDNYIIEYADTSESISYIQMWGTLDSGNLFMVSSTMESMQENAEVANHFLIYAGLLSFGIGMALTLVFAKTLSDPIRSLTNISEGMANLDFNARYEGDYANEIGILGERMNVMSETLEKTITELKSANNELRRDIENKEAIDEMRGEFISNVSHELKTPLALLIGYAEGLKEGINDDPEGAKEYAEIILDEGNKMNELVKRLTTLNRIEFGNDVVDFTRFNISELIANYLESVKLLIKQKDAVVEFDGSTPCYVYADDFYVEEVLNNYVTNALQHLDGRKVISIKVEREIENVRVSVFNTGHSISDDAMPHLFEKFYKEDKARSREYGGSGIGLSIVKAILDNMDQHYGARNILDGVEFYFTLEKA